MLHTSTLLHELSHMQLEPTQPGLDPLPPQPHEEAARYVATVHHGLVAFLDFLEDHDLSDAEDLFAYVQREDLFEALQDVSRFVALG